jgi:hypothetical protein
MEINWSALDGVLGVALVILVIWVALKVVTRIVIGGILALLILAFFFARHLGYLDIGF